MIAEKMIDITTNKELLQEQLRQDDFHRQGDFELIGGREQWMTYVKEVPAFWTIYGFAITIQWIVGFLSTTVTTFVIIIVSSLSAR